MRSCVTCAYCVGSHDHLFACCSKFPRDHANYVTGERWQEIPLCHYVRDDGSRCGPDGRFWEPIPERPEQPKRGRLWGFLRKLHQTLRDT
jgi:hypothetical protein